MHDDRSHHPSDGDRPDARASSSRIAGGDERAFVDFYDEWKPHVERAVRTALRDDSLVPDVTQEVFMRVIRALPVLESRRAIGAWLTTTSRRCAVDALRSTQRHRRNDALAHDRDDAEASDAHELTRAMALLDDAESELRGMIEARVRFGWTLDRVGRAFGVTPSAVDGRIKRALRRMRTTLTQGDRA